MYLRGMGRLNRNKNTKRVSITKAMNIFDAGIISQYRMTEQEYDFMCKNCTDLELEYISSEPVFMTFAEKRTLIKILNKYIA